MGSDFKTIPIIDISPLLDKIDDPKMVEDKEVLEVVRLLDKACKEAGFFYVKGHGIPESLVKDVRDITRRFFSLPCEDKVKIKMTSESGYRGYQRVGENVTKGKPDMHEAIDCYRPLEPGSFGDLGKPLEGPNLWPDHPSNFKEIMEEYISLVRDLSRKIMRGIALALGGPVDALEGERAGDSFWVMRLIGYPVSTDIPEEELTDTGWYRNTLNKFFVNVFLKLTVDKVLNTFSRLFSCILQQNLAELIQIMVRNRSGEWICAVPIPGTFVCNIGDMLKVWSNGLYEPTLHRVVNNSPKYRVSVVYFYEPNFDTAVEPLEFCKRKTGGATKYEKVVYGEHLVRKVLTNFVD